MKKATSLEEEKQLTFDCYCKRVLKHETIDIQRNNQYLNAAHVSFSKFNTEQFGELSTYDVYSTDYSEFKVLEYDIAVKDELLAEALQQLPDKKRDIVLISYFLEYSDMEIADLLHIVRRTVNDSGIKH